MGWTADPVDGTTLAALAPDDRAALFAPCTLDLAVGVTSSSVSASAAVESVAIVGQ